MAISTIIDSPNAHQRLSGIQGRRFHDECVDALRMAGFEIADQCLNVATVGIELDCITNNRQGIAMPWEFKGSWQGDRPGLRRTDTLKKAIANGYLFAQSELYQLMTPLLVMTTHFPLDGSGLSMLRTVKREIVLAFVDSRDSKRLRWLVNADEQALRRFIAE